MKSAEEEAKELGISVSDQSPPLETKLSREVTQHQFQ